MVSAKGVNSMIKPLHKFVLIKKEEKRKNKMKKKIVTLLLVAAMTGTMVVGCGSKADDKTSDTKTEQTDDKKDTEEIQEAIHTAFI